MKTKMFLRTVLTYSVEYDDDLITDGEALVRATRFRENYLRMMALGQGMKTPVEAGVSILTKEQALGALE